uniref:Major facilitator superfamily (MFS) profile domain-containing protein n=1 Tax=Kalanchoe fedtschenkoi TaxID=63787 RepID=A0A7N0UP08_KALFE
MEDVESCRKEAYGGGMKEPLIQLHKDGKNQSIKESNGVVFLSTFVAVLGSYQFGSCVGFSAPTQSAIRQDLQLSLAEYSFFGSLVTVGAMIGSISSGRIADSIGRKQAMRVSALFSVIGWIAVFLCQGAISLDTGRFLTGYAIGVFSYVVPVYIAEIAPKNLRGGLGTLNQLMIVLGASLAYIIGTVISWRLLALTAVIPGVVQLLGLFLIPESPRWLAKCGYEEECHYALQTLRGNHVDISEEVSAIKNTVSTGNLHKSRPLDLFQRRYLHSIIIGVGLIALQQFGGCNGVGFYSGETFKSAGFASGKIGIIAFACLQIPLTAVAAFLMDRCGRKPLLLVSATGTFLGSFLSATAFLVKAQRPHWLEQWVPLLVLAGVLLYIGSFSIGMGAVPWVIMSEVFPINVKGSAGSMVTLAHWLCAWAVSYTYNFLTDWSFAGTFYLYSGICAATVVFVAKVVPETKGRTLEEIQASMN